MVPPSIPLLHLQPARFTAQNAFYSPSPSCADYTRIHGCSLSEEGNRKTGQLVKFELTDQTREAVEAWIAKAQLSSGQFLFPSRMTQSPHTSTRQYGRIVKSWVARIGLDPGDYGTHSMRRTKATLIDEHYETIRQDMFTLFADLRITA